MSQPAITVLMPVYNAARFLREALESILAQSFRDFELLIINDGSTDDSKDILSAYNDSRVRIVETPNRGVTASLRLGLRLARGSYVARMDADDVALPHRLEVQKAILDAFPQVVVTHSRVDRIDENGQLVEPEYGILRNNIETKWALLWHNVIFHPTVMLRVDALRRARINYRRETMIAQDFDLWSQLSMIGDFHMHNAVLLRYRLHGDKVSRPENAHRQLEVLGRLIRDNFSRYGMEIEESTAREIAVASGSTLYNMTQWPYVSLPDNLLKLTTSIEHKFVVHHDVKPELLYREQARLFAQWARSFASDNSLLALKLLGMALLRRPVLLMQGRCWAILAGVCLPRSWISRFERGERGLSASQYLNSKASETHQ